jgi:hypothetical protein
MTGREYLPLPPLEGDKDLPEDKADCNRSSENNFEFKQYAALAIAVDILL